MREAELSAEWGWAYEAGLSAARRRLRREASARRSRAFWENWERLRMFGMRAVPGSVLGRMGGLEPFITTAAKEERSRG